MEFNKLKLTRTWLNGSKSAEYALIDELLDKKNDNKNPNWIEYRRTYMKFAKDYMILYGSWKYVLNIGRYIMAIITLISIFISIIAFYILLGVAILTLIAYSYVKKKEIQFMDFHVTNMEFTNGTIEVETGLKLSKDIE